MIRCEVSLDSGENWRRAEIERHEEPTPHNKTWCWVFWSIAVTAVELVRAPELRVRAVDSSQNMMPEKCAPKAQPCQCMLCLTMQYMNELHLVILKLASKTCLSTRADHGQGMLGISNHMSCVFAANVQC